MVCAVLRCLLSIASPGRMLHGLGLWECFLSRLELGPCEPPHRAQPMLFRQAGRCLQEEWLSRAHAEEL